MFSVGGGGGCGLICGTLRARVQTITAQKMHTSPHGVIKTPPFKHEPWRCGLICGTVRVRVQNITAQKMLTSPHGIMQSI